MCEFGGWRLHFELARLPADPHPAISEVVEQLVVSDIANAAIHIISRHYCSKPAAEALLMCDDCVFALALISAPREDATPANYRANPSEILEQIGIGNLRLRVLKIA